MLGKRSYTGENTVEIHCHGGSLITRRVFEKRFWRRERARARPGEFTFKAFINGKLDLAQAEAVQALSGLKMNGLSTLQKHISKALFPKKSAIFKRG